MVDIIPFSNSEKDDMLRLAACLEEHFPHSMANAVVRAAREQGLAHEEMHSEVEYIVAHGISSRVGGERVVIGSYHFVFEDEHCIVPADEQEKFDRMPAEYSHLYMAASVLRQLHNLSTIGISLRSMTNLIQKPSSAPQLEG